MTIHEFSEYYDEQQSYTEPKVSYLTIHSALRPYSTVFYILYW